ncbi:hypothetical protein EsH8_II_000748 [Colletotrichum jinshuiense]
MAETSMRKKRLAEDDDDEGDEHLFKRSRGGGVGSGVATPFKWLWSPSLTHSPHNRPPPGLWSHAVPDGLFLGQDNVPRSISLPPETPYARRPRRRGAISLTSASPNELDRQLALQLQQQIAIIRIKAAETHRVEEEGCEDDADDADKEVDRIRRELEGVQIDATLPSILGICIDLDRKLCLGPSSDRLEGPGRGETGSSARADSTASASCRLWGSGKARLGRGNATPDLPPRRNGCAVQQQHVSNTSRAEGLWRTPRT